MAIKYPIRSLNSESYMWRDPTRVNSAWKRIVCPVAVISVHGIPMSLLLSDKDALTSRWQWHNFRVHSYSVRYWSVTCTSKLLTECSAVSTRGRGYFKCFFVSKVLVNLGDLGGCSPRKIFYFFNLWDCSWWLLWPGFQWYPLGPLP
jgi:hypothetical protein